MTIPRLIGTHHHPASRSVTDNPNNEVDSSLVGVVKDLTNNSGGTVAFGDVVRLETAAASSIDTTTTLGDSGIAGVVAGAGPYANGALVPVLILGYHSAVNVTAATAVGDYLVAATTAKSATPVGSARAGAFARALTSSAGAGTVAAIVYAHDVLEAWQPVTAAGDLLAGAAAGQMDNVPVSPTDFDILTANPAAPLKMAWRSLSDILTGLDLALAPTRVYIPFGSATENGHTFVVDSATTWLQFGEVSRELNADHFPSLPNAVLEVVLQTNGGGDVSARLFDVTAGAPVASSTASTGGGSPTRVRSAAFSLEAADHIYRVEFGGANPGTYVCFDAVLILGDATLNPIVAGAEVPDMANEFKNFPSLESADNVQPDWWDVAANCTLTEVDVVGEGITESFGRALKVVTTADSYASQRFTYADEPRLKSGQTVSMLVAVWAVGGATARVRAQSSVGSLGVATSAAASWALLEIPAVVLNGTYLEARFEVATGTAYFVPLGLLIGSTGQRLRPRGLRYRYIDAPPQSVNLNTATQGSFQDLDLTSVTSNLAAMAELEIRIWCDSAGENWALDVRRKGSSTTANLIVAQAAVPTAEVEHNRISLLLNAGQVCQYKLTAAGSAGAPGNGSSIYTRGFWEWE